MSLGMLARVNIKAIRGGVPAIVIGEIVGHRPPNDLNGEAFDVMLPPGCCAAQHHRGTESNPDPRVAINARLDELEFAGEPVRKITFPAKAYEMRDAERAYGVAA